MIFPIPQPTLWDDPGPLPISGFWRRLWGTTGQPLFHLRAAWIDQWKRYSDRQKRLLEEEEFYLEQQEQYELMMAQYQEQGEFWADSLPRYLHHLGLSHRRLVQERKDERPYTKIDYCEIETWYFDEYAYYFWIVTWPLPYGVSIDKFFPNQEENNPVAMTLTGAFGARVMVEFNAQNHDRPGLWIVAEHKTGRGQIPLHVSYEKMMQLLPTASQPLSFPLGQGQNNRSFLVDLEEVTNLLIGGSQGGGKSNALNVVLTTLISRNSPTELRLFLADMKRVELSFYRGLPHLGGDVGYLQKETLDKDGNPKPGPIHTVAQDYKPKEGQTVKPPLGKNIIMEGDDLVKILDYALAEIQRRTDMLEGKVKKVSTWNKRYPHKKLSRWVIVIDELADVMLQPSLKRKIEPTLVRISQLGRALGIHLILATQTPKNEIVTMLIQNNIINRIVFRCGTGQASGVMLDGLYDAARLPAHPGRAIFREGSRMVELQTPEITDLSIQAAVRHAKQSPDSPTHRAKVRNIAPDKIFEYALKELDGFCAVKELFSHFRAQGVKQLEISEILQEYQVAGYPPALEPEIEIGDDEQIYYLAPSIVGSKTPRRLIKADQFIAEFDKKWASLLAVGAAPAAAPALAGEDDVPNITTRVSQLEKSTNSAEGEGAKIQNPTAPEAELTMEV